MRSGWLIAGWLVACTPAGSGVQDVRPWLDIRVEDRTTDGVSLDPVYRTLAFFEMYAATTDFGVEGIAVVDDPADPTIGVVRRWRWLDLPVRIMEGPNLPHVLCHRMDDRLGFSRTYAERLTFDQLPELEQRMATTDHATEAEEAFALLCDEVFLDWNHRLQARVCGAPEIDHLQELATEAAFPRMTPEVRVTARPEVVATWSADPRVIFAGLGDGWVWGFRGADAKFVVRLDAETGIEIDRTEIPIGAYRYFDGRRMLALSPLELVALDGGAASRASLPAPVYASSWAAVPDEAAWFGAWEDGLWRLDTDTGAWTPEPLPEGARGRLVVKGGWGGPYLAAGARVWAWDDGAWLRSTLPVDEGFAQWIEVEGGRAVMQGAPDLTLRGPDGSVGVAPGFCDERRAEWYAYGDRAFSATDLQATLWAL